MNLNLKSKTQNSYDAIVVGSGISGGWAAKELTEKGLRVLLLERGPDVKHIEGYETALKAPWEFPHRGRLTNEVKENYPVQARKYALTEATTGLMTQDIRYPYLEAKPFQWTRAFVVGGRSLVWGRQSYRWSDLDFEANLKDGHGVDWPIRYKDLAPWYDYVERFIGVSGSAEGLPQLPDGVFQAPMELSCVEQHVRSAIEQKWKVSRKLMIGRSANLTAPTPEQLQLGRASCQFRNLCSRGCPYGAYFSTQSATLPAAMATGRLTLRPNSLVHEVIFDENRGRATGVKVIDQESKEEIIFHARVIFLNASTMATNFLLLNSTSPRFPEGLGNNETASLGKFIMDHHQSAGAKGTFRDFNNKYFFGRRANGIYVARYRNYLEKGDGYFRGFGYQGGGSRGGWQRGTSTKGFGAGFKDKLSAPGDWSMNLNGYGECLPYEENRVYLDRTRKDPWGLPMLVADAEYRENEKAMRKDMMSDAAEMLEAAGATDISTFDDIKYIGFCTHEMGGVRMGRDPKTSILNQWNQFHQVPNLFATDGSAMTSSSCSNPSLTYMALTARAADYAVTAMKKNEF
ncbi:GMC family oxidoreductase [Ravibacter arvi]|uniref:GMC family oxidoreductase n=1 Tax=Ravibacter arvi TaxID=2051041 RepID=A0ABP8LTX6_9BACT